MSCLTDQLYLLPRRAGSELQHVGTAMSEGTGTAALHSRWVVLPCMKINQKCSKITLDCLDERQSSGMLHGLDGQTSLLWSECSDKQ